MTVAIKAPVSKWRNFAGWSAVGALFSFVAMLGVTTLRFGQSVDTLFRSSEVAAVVALSVLLSAACIGFSLWRRPLTLRSLRNFVLLSTGAATAFLLTIWGFGALARVEAIGMSEWVAAVTGATLAVVASMGMVAVASAHSGAHLIDDEAAAEEMRERGRLFVCSFAWMAGCGVLLVVLAVAGTGVLAPGAALAAAGVLIALLIVLGVAAWRLSDELGRTLSHESGNLAFYLIVMLGGGWALLAHLGFAAAPAPLDWLTLFTVLLYAAGFIAAGRRKLLTR